MFEQDSIQRMQREMEQTWKQFRETFRRLEHELPEREQQTQLPMRVPINVKESDDELVITADLPGVDRDDINVNVSRDKIRIGADVTTEREEQEGGLLPARARITPVLPFLPPAHTGGPG